jgi:hypothetical protein
MARRSHLHEQAAHGHMLRQKLKAGHTRERWEQ